MLVGGTEHSRVGRKWVFRGKFMLVEGGTCNGDNLAEKQQQSGVSLPLHPVHLSLQEPAWEEHRHPEGGGDNGCGGDPRGSWAARACPLCNAGPWPRWWSRATSSHARACTRAHTHTHTEFCRLCITASTLQLKIKTLTYKQQQKTADPFLAADHVFSPETMSEANSCQSPRSQAQALNQDPCCVRHPRRHRQGGRPHGTSSRPSPAPSCAHLHEEERPDPAPAFGLGEGTVSGQVAALDGERVVAHAQDGDAQDKDQGVLRAQAQEPCGERVLRLFPHLSEISAQTPAPPHLGAQATAGPALGPAQAAVRQVPLWPEGGGLVLSAGCGTKQSPIDSPKDIHCRSLDSGAVMGSGHGGGPNQEQRSRGHRLPAPPPH